MQRFAFLADFFYFIIIIKIFFFLLNCDPRRARFRYAIDCLYWKKKVPHLPLSQPRFQMDLALTSSFRSLSLPEYTHFRRNLYKPFSLRRQLSPKPTLSRQTVIVMAQKKPKIEGLSDELNSIASQNLDHAPARRRVRSAFANVQQQLDHILFKVLLQHILCFFFPPLNFDSG